MEVTVGDKSSLNLKTKLRRPRMLKISVYGQELKDHYHDTAGINISLLKSEYICVCTNDDDTLYMNSTTLNWLQEYKCLRILLHKN